MKVIIGLSGKFDIVRFFGELDHFIEVAGTIFQSEERDEPTFNQVGLTNDDLRFIRIIPKNRIGHDGVVFGKFLFQCRNVKDTS